MSRTCTVYHHDQRHDVEVALIRREPFRHIEQRYSLAVRPSTRHAHPLGILLNGRKAQEMADAVRLNRELERLEGDLEHLKDEAERSSAQGDEAPPPAPANAQPTVGRPVLAVQEESSPCGKEKLRCSPQRS